MLQALLAERFQLKVHHETKDIAGYALTVVKGGRLKASEADCAAAPSAESPSAPCGSFLIRANRLDGTRVDMKQLAATLADQRDVARPVVDSTGMAGAYDVHLEWAPFGGGGVAPPPSSENEGASSLPHWRNNSG